MTATDELRRMLDERGVEHEDDEDVTRFFGPDGFEVVMQGGIDGKLDCLTPLYLTPAQAIAATLGREPWVNPTWERWHKSLKHDEIKSIGDAVEQLMYEAIKFGGYMGPNGNTYNGIDEGDVLTSGFINEWIRRFESTLGRDKYSYKQWREISNAVGDAMEYAHDKAIECPDKADPLWNLDEHVNRILKVAFEGEDTLGAGTCHDKGNIERFICSECGCRLDLQDDDWEATMWLDGAAMVPNFCPNCGSKVVDA